MLISVCQGTFNGAHAFQGTAVQTANFIQMKGACVCRFCFRRLFVVRSPWVLLLQPAANCSLFAFVRCYCLRVGALVCACTLFEAVYLPFARLLCFCNTLPALHAFARLYGLYCIAASFGAPSVRRINARRGKDWRMAARGQAPRLRGCVYSLRSPSASRCSFSAIK